MPLVNDVTTTPQDPPQFEAFRSASSASGRDMTYSGLSLEQHKQHYPKLVPLQINLPAAQLFKLAQAVAEAMPRWNLLAVDVATFRLQAVASTLILRFKDDVVIEVRSVPQGSELHMRSKSRLGKSDFGANAKRISAFLAAVKAKF